MAGGFEELPPIGPRRIGTEHMAKVLLVVVLLGVVFGSLVLSVGTIEVGKVAVVVDPIQRKMWMVGDGASAQYFFKPPWATVVKVYVATDAVHTAP